MTPEYQETGFLPMYFFWALNQLIYGAVLRGNGIVRPVFENLTIFPVLSEAITGEKITVGPPFYNQVNIPIGLFLLLLTGIGPLLVWRKTSKTVLLKNFKIPMVVLIISFGHLL